MTTIPEKNPSDKKGAGEEVNEDEESPLPTQLNSDHHGADEDDDEESPLPTQLNTSWVPDGRDELPDSTSSQEEEVKDRPSSRTEAESEQLNDSVDLLADQDDEEEAVEEEGAANDDQDEVSDV